MTTCSSFHPVSTFAARCAERRSLLTRAATAECERQAAHERKDWPSVAQREAELHRLWKRFAQLGDDE
jgi:hypothetical protein